MFYTSHIQVGLIILLFVLNKTFLLGKMRNLSNFASIYFFLFRFFNIKCAGNFTYYILKDWLH